MKTLVTGGTGLVGSTIDADIKLSTKDVDLRDWTFLQKTLPEKQIPTNEQYKELNHKIKSRRIIIRKKIPVIFLLNS